MLKITRVASSLDTARLGKALAAPGMDPRLWVSYAYVTAVGVTDGEGTIVDVVCLPGGLQTSARVATEYAGPGFGTHIPINVDDEVLVECPSGDPDHGLVVTRRFHSMSDPPPQAAIDHPSDYVLVTAPDTSVRIAAAGTGLVVLGDPEATAKVALDSTLLDLNAALSAAIGALGVDPSAAALVALQTALATLPAGAPNAGKSFPVCAGKVTAK